MCIYIKKLRVIFDEDRRMDRLTELILKEWVEFPQWKREWETLFFGIFLSSDRTLISTICTILKLKTTFFED